MKISGGQWQRIVEMYGRTRGGRPTPPTEGPGTGERADTVEVSRAAHDAQRFRAQLDPVPPARQQRLDEIRRSIRAGTYQVPAADVAQRLLDTRVLDARIEEEPAGGTQP